LDFKLGDAIKPWKEALSLRDGNIRPDFAEPPNEGAIRCRQRLGGLLRYYYREAA
jgi:hypothetical protein